MLHPAVSVGDSGELITAAYTLGIAHPPGYPLWTVLGKIFTIIIPFGNIAYRINLMSAFFGAMTCGLVYLTVSNLATQRHSDIEKKPNNSVAVLLCCCVAALSLAFSKTFWSQSIISEVYTLNSFFVVLIIYLLLTTYYLRLPVFIYGLSLTNHYIMFLFGPIFAIYFLWKNPKVFNIKNILLLSVFLILGLFLYLYLLIRSSINPPIDWGNPENLKNFIAHIGRFQYKGLELATKVGFETKLLFVRNFFNQLIQNFGLFAVLSVFGLVSLFKKDLKFVLLTIFIFLANTLGLIVLLNFKFTPQDIDAVTPYYIPAWIMVAIWAGYKICELRNIKFFLPVVLAVLAFQIVRNYRFEIPRYNFIAYDYPTDILKSVSKNGVLYLHDEVDETIFTLSYLKNVLHKRPDVTVVDSYSNIFSAKNLAQKSVRYYSTVNTEKIEKTLSLNGLIWTTDNDKKNNFQFFYIQRLFKKCYEYREQEVVARYPYFYGKFLIDNNNKEKGISELKKVIQSGKDLVWLNNNVGDILRYHKDFNGAFKALSHTIQIDSSYSPAYYNLGLLYLEKHNDDKAIEHFQKAYQYDKTDTDSLFQLSKIYQRKGYKNFVDGKIDEAIAEYKKAIEFTPSEADIYYNIGVIYSQTQDKKEAKNYFQKYLQLNTGGPNAETVRKWFTTNISD